jgi:hypothetical protein
MKDQKVRENRLRRIASRRGVTLTKSRRRDPRAYDYNTWSVDDHRLKNGVATVEFGWQLDDVEAWLSGPAHNRVTNRAAHGRSGNAT